MSAEKVVLCLLCLHCTLHLVHPVLVRLSSAYHGFEFVAMPPYEATDASVIPNSVAAKSNTLRSPSSHLRPEDAFHANSPPRGLPRNASTLGRSDAASNVKTATGSDGRRARSKRRGRSSDGRRKGAWKKLLWVKQPCMYHTISWCHQGHRM